MVAQDTVSNILEKSHNPEHAFFKENMDKKLEPLFQSIFGKQSRNTNYEFESHSKWPEYYRTILAHKEILGGVLICKLEEGPWFPIYQSTEHGNDWKELKPTNTKRCFYFGTRQGVRK
jgi:hypothetical protein